MESILTSIKKLLGIDESYTVYDNDIIMHINSVFMVLNDLGVGPSKAFKIHDDIATWKDFIEDQDDMEDVKTYVYQKVKYIFDPPLNATVLNALKNSIDEFEWRQNFRAESKK